MHGDELGRLISAVGGRLDLAVADLGSERLTQVLAPYLRDGRLTIRDVTTPIESERGIELSGTGDARPFESMRVTATFSLRDGAPSVLIVAAGGNDWTLPRAFPELQGSLFDQLRFSTQGSGPTLTLRSHDLSPDAPAGMRFDATLAEESIFAGFAFLFGARSHDLHGTIGISNSFPEIGSEFTGAPDIAIFGPEGATVDLGLFRITDLRYEIFADPWVNVDALSIDVRSYVSYTGVIAFEAQGTRHQIFLGADAAHPGSAIRLRADLTALGDIALHEIESLIDGIGLPIPFDIRIEGLVRLTDLQMLVDPSAAPHVRYVTIKLETAQSWTIVPNLVMLQELDLHIRIDDPLGVRDASSMVSGLVGIGQAGTLELSIVPGENLLAGGLRQGDPPLKLREVYEHFTDTTGSHVPDLTVSVFDFRIQRPARPGDTASYSGDLELVGEWVIDDGTPSLALVNVKCALAHAEADGTQFSLQAGFVIAGVTVFIDAHYDQAMGWSFSGETGPGQEIPLGHLVAALTSELGDFSLPAPIADLVIENLHASFNGDGSERTFACACTLPLEGETLDITVTISLLRTGDTVEPHIGGHIDIGGRTFNLTFDEDTTSHTFTALYTNPTGDTTSVKALTAQLSEELAGDVPEGLELTLKDALFAYQRGPDRPSRDDEHDDATTPDDSTPATTAPRVTTFLFGLTLGAAIDLSNLPLVGHEMPPDQSVTVDDLQFVIASQTIEQSTVEAINRLLPTEATRLPAARIASGVSLSATMAFGGETEILSLGMSDGGSPADSQDRAGEGAAATTDDTGGQATGPSVPGANGPPAAPSDDTKWFKIQKSFGPVHVERVGVQYRDAALWFLLDAALTAGALTLELEGLAVGSPLSAFEPRFDLRGIGLDYRSATRIAGFFQRVQVEGEHGRYDEYDGLATISTENFTLAAIGSYAWYDGDPSLFVYAVLDYPLGGPSFFFVTGLAAGFGYNRALIPPAIDQIADFPLVAEALQGAGTVPTPAPGGEQRDFLQAEMAKLREAIPLRIGDCFLALGVRFTSFKLVDSFALLTVSFGHTVEIDILGLSTAIIPTPEAGKGVTPLAELQVAFKATFRPEEGSLSVLAQLTRSSYILSKACHLTGGYAFSSWFTGEHAGDFVMTLGGYHPHFAVPPHYPKVPRLAFNWQVSDELSIKGDAYYALTGHAFMAGGHLQVTWESGPLSAWFNAGADFLISWKPYHYEASVYIDIGVSYTFEFFGTHHITIDVGADLDIWGPEFSGRAHVHLWIVSFTVSFGDSAPGPAPIPWETFRTSFLPAPQSPGATETDLPGEPTVCSVAVRAGLVRKVGGDDAEALPIINPKELLLVTDTIIPSTQALLGGRALRDTHDTRYGIAPMGLHAGDLESTHEITVTLDGDNAADQLAFTPVLKRMPGALWGDSLLPDLNGPHFVENALAGFELRPRTPAHVGESHAIPRENLQFSTTPVSDAFRFEPAPAFVFETAPGEASVGERVVSDAAVQARTRLLTALGFAAEDGLVSLDPQRVDAFVASPLVGAVVARQPGGTGGAGDGR